MRPAESRFRNAGSPGGGANRAPAFLAGWGTRLLAGGLLTVLVGFGAVLAANEPTASTDPLHLQVIATHDFHGALRPITYQWSNGREVGGAAALKALTDSIASGCDCPTVRVDGGDEMQGSLESNLVFGASVVAAFNLLGVDAAAVGNHELDWGVDTLLARQSEAHYPWLSANVFNVEGGDRPAWATPYTVLERSGVRVGVVGYTTVSTPRTQRPERTRPYEFRSGYEGIRDALDAVWAQRPDFVIVVAHAPGDCDENGCSGEMVRLASELPPGSVHLIVGGHDHSPGEGVVNSIPIIRAGSNGRAVSVVDLYRLDDGTHAFRTSRRTVYVDEVQEDTAMLALLLPYSRMADAKGHEQVTTLAEPLSRSASGDRRLGYLIAEAQRVAADADVGLHNPGGVRADLQPGPVSYLDLHRVMPFDNTVVRLTLTGRRLRELVERVGPRYYVSNLRIERDSLTTQGGEATVLSFPDGTPILDDRTYTVGTNDFLADGGDALTILTELPREDLGVSLLDALVEYFRELPSPLVPPTGGDGSLESRPPGLRVGEDRRQHATGPTTP